MRGILSVLQTPFDESAELDAASLGRLTRDAIASGADGLLAPVVASEVEHIDDAERERVVRTVAEVARGQVPWILGASAGDVETCHRHAALAAELGATAYLVAVPARLYRARERILPFFESVAAGNDAPLVVQDYEPSGPGLEVEEIVRLRETLGGKLLGVKIETVPAGPKYSAVRAACGDDLFVAGGWAVPQMIEALDRGVHAMIPESSMIRVYKAVDRAYREGVRGQAAALFRRLLPVLAFANQDLATSIAFFKRLLVRKEIFETPRQRMPFRWDDTSERIAQELIDLYLDLEAEVEGAGPDLGTAPAS